MKRTLKRTLTSVAVAAVLVSPLANATNGYFKIGYGSKNRGMAGAGMAYGQDSLAGAVNPAALSGIGDRLDAGMEIFKPKRKGQVDATGIGIPDLDGPGPATALQGSNSSHKSRSSVFLIPNFGISKAWTNKLTLGISVVANGGMNTRYGNADAGVGNIFTEAFAPTIGQTSTTGLPVPPAPSPGPSGFAGFLEVVGTPATGPIPSAAIDPQLFNASGTGLYQNPNNSPALGVNLAQALIAPTLSYQINQNHSVGFSPVIGYQTFRAYGLGLFQAFSNDPGNVTNNGNDEAFGMGARVGYQGDFGMFSFGASATSKIYMEEFDDYAGLFAEKGDFDIPATFGAGIAIHATPKLTVAADITRIMYSDVKAINNDGPTANEFFGAFLNALVNPSPAPGSFLDKGLGKNDGFGFGWDDVWVYKIGVNYAYSNQWTFRAGFNYSEVPYDEDQALFNVLAPAVVEKHVTAGFTYSPNLSNEFTVTYMHAFRNDVEHTYVGSGNFTGFSYKAKNDMYQNAIEASYAWKF